MEKDALAMDTKINGSHPFWLQGPPFTRQVAFINITPIGPKEESRVEGEDYPFKITKLKLN